MKKVLLLLLLPVLISYSSLAQKATPVVRKPVYFDVSPPLRELAKLYPMKIDNTKEEVVKNFFTRSNREFPADYIDAVRQNTNGTKIPLDTTLQNWEGASNTQGVIPPDTYGDVSADYYFQDVNMHYAIYDKTGGLLLTASNMTIWNGMPNNYNGGDGVVNYDEQADRWLFTQLSYSGNHYWQMVAVSQTADPTGTWYRWEYDFGSDLPDYPKWGVWPDGYYFCYNIFAGGSSYVGIGASALDRTSMLAGNSTAEMVSFSISTSSNTALPADCDGVFPPLGTPEYFTYIDEGADALKITEFAVDWATPTNSTFGNTLTLPVTTFNGNQGNIPQLGTTRKLDAIPDRLMFRAQYRKFGDHESMVMNHTVNAGSSVAGVRWYELRKTSGDWTVYQQSTYSPDANCRWMASIAMDAQGNIALGYSVSSSTMYPAIRYTGRLAGDPLNTMTVAEQSIMEGGGAETSATSRWGDYSSMTVDQLDNFWYTTEYFATTSSSAWKTRVASFNFANILNLTLTASQTSICTGDTTQLNATVTGGSGTYTYSWTSDPPGFTDTIPNPAVSPLVTTNYICTVNDTISTKTDTIKITVNQAPAVFAGNDTTFFVTLDSYQAAGTDTNCWSVKWETLGFGTFDNAFILNPVYTTGWQDRMAGSFTLILKGFPHPPCTETALDSITVTFTPSVGIDPVVSGQFNISLYPNPAQSSCQLIINNLKDEKADITITDMSGRQVFSDIITGPQRSYVRNIDLSRNAKGVYFVKVKAADGSKVQKLVVN